MLNKLKPREIKLLLALLVVAILFGPYWILYRPQSQALEENQNRLELVKRNIRVESTKLRNRASIEREHEIILNELQRSQGNFIKLEEELDKVIYLNELSLDSGVNLISLRPNRARSDETYTELPYSLEMTGDYNSILDYIEGIADIEYITRINELRLRADLLPTDELKVDIGLSTFSLDQMEGGVR